MKMAKKYADPFGFIAAIGNSEKGVSRRLVFLRKDGSVGITHQYADDDVLKAVREEAESTGAKYLREVVCDQAGNYNLGA